MLVQFVNELTIFLLIGTNHLLRANFLEQSVVPLVELEHTAAVLLLVVF